MVLVIICIVYQIRVIIRQDKIAKVREDFSYAMIHDMKTPLSSILMGTEILESGRLDGQPEKKERYFRIVKEEGEHLLALTNKVLTPFQAGESCIEVAASGLFAAADFGGLGGEVQGKNYQAGCVCMGLAGRCGLGR